MANGPVRPNLSGPLHGYLQRRKFNDQPVSPTGPRVFEPTIRGYEQPGVPSPMERYEIKQPRRRKI